MLHKQEADELGAHLKKIVDTERKADQRRKAPNSQKGVYLWGLRACWWVPFIRFALMQIMVRCCAGFPDYSPMQSVFCVEGVEGGRGLLLY